MKKLISFDDETFASLTELDRSRTAIIRQLADEAFRDVVKKRDLPSAHYETKARQIIA